MNLPIQVTASGPRICLHGKDTLSGEESSAHHVARQSTSRSWLVLLVVRPFYDVYDAMTYNPRRSVVKRFFAIRAVPAAPFAVRVVHLANSGTAVRR